MLNKKLFYKGGYYKILEVSFDKVDSLIFAY